MRACRFNARHYEIRFASAQRGFAIVSYLIAALALFIIVTAALVKSSNGATATDQQWAIASQIVAQANVIRSKILECASQSGSNGSANHPAYPLGSNSVVTNLVCPSNGATLFNGTDGVYMPPAPSNDFKAWTYTNDATSVRIHLAPKDGLASSYELAFTKAREKFGNQGTLDNNMFNLIIVN